MPRALNKADRLSFIEQTMSDADIGDDYATAYANAASEYEQVAEELRSLSESMIEVATQAAEAQSYHEARDWEMRSDALETLSTALTQVEEALEAVDAFTPPEMPDMDMLRTDLEKVRSACDESQDHMEHIL